MFTIVGPRWGTSAGEFEDDHFGPGGKSAGVMMQLPLDTKEGRLLVIGTYWPIRHADEGNSDQNLWSCLQRYINKHRGGDQNPTAMLQRKIVQWAQTAVKWGSKATIVMGDLNASWRSNEAGGQTSLRDWAEARQFTNGPLLIANAVDVELHTRGGDGERLTWIDHVLFKGPKEVIEVTKAYVGIGAEWTGTSDHRPLWATFAVGSPYQGTPERQELAKVRWELDLSDRRMQEAFEEGMARFHVSHPPPGHTGYVRGM